MLEIKDLHVSVIDGDNEILKGLSLNIKPGEVHAIMGPNGTGKSTLSKTIMGNYKYKINSGEILFNGVNINNLEVDERAKLGIFLCMQDPMVIEGVSNSEFIRTAKNEITGEKVNLFSFVKDMEKNMEAVGLDKITHYPRILEYIKPDFVHIMNDGVIQKTGDMKLAFEIDKSGYGVNVMIGNDTNE